MNKIFEFTVACPMYNKTQVVSLNNISKWFRYSSSKISNEYKNLLMEWNIPKATKKYEKAYIIFELYRHNKRIFDSDNLGFVVKWTIDAIKKSDWLIDDDQILYTVVPSILDEKLKETEIKIIMFENKKDYIEYIGKN